MKSKVGHPSQLSLPCLLLGYATLLLLAVAPLLALGSKDMDNPSLSQSCQLIESDKLNITLPTTISHTLPYTTIESVIGLALYYETELANEKVKNGGRRWMGEMAVNLCKSQNTDYKVDNIDISATHNLDQHDALLLDMILIQNDQDKEIICQTDVPSSQIMVQDDCQASLDGLADYLGIATVNISHLELKGGANEVFVNTLGYTMLKPKNVVCQNRETIISGEAERIAEETVKVIQKLRVMDQSLGSHYLKNMDDISKKCGFESLENLMESDPKAEKVKECFKLNMRTKQNRKKRDLTLIKTGGEQDGDPAFVAQINENFDRLNRNEKKLFKEMLTLGLNKKLETTVIHDQEENLKNINNAVTGLEVYYNIERNFDEFLEHVVKHAKTTLNLLLDLQDRIHMFQRYLSEALEGKQLICIEMDCFTPAEMFLSSQNVGLSLFIKASRLKASPGLSPACILNKQNMISKYHMQHLVYLNESHFQDSEDNYVKRACLENYNQCDKEKDMRNIESSDLLENNLLLSPSKDFGYRMQCLNPIVVQSAGKYQRCSREVTATKLPLSLPSGMQVGLADLKISQQDDPSTSLKELAHHMFKSSILKIKEMEMLNNIKWNKMFQMKEVNESHIEGGITAGSVMTGLLVLACILKCTINACDGKTPCGTSCRGKNEEGKENKKSRSWRWRRRGSSTSEDDIEMIGNAPTQATAPPPEEVGGGPIANLDTMPKPRYVLDLGSLIRSSQ